MSTVSCESSPKEDHSSGCGESYFQKMYERAWVQVDILRWDIEMQWRLVMWCEDLLVEPHRGGVIISNLKGRHTLLQIWRKSRSIINKLSRRRKVRRCITLSICLLCHWITHSSCSHHHHSWWYNWGTNRLLWWVTRNPETDVCEQCRAGGSGLYSSWDICQVSHAISPWSPLPSVTSSGHRLSACKMSIV